MRALSNQSSSRTPARSLTFTAVASLIAVVPQLELQLPETARAHVPHSRVSVVFCAVFQKLCVRLRPQCRRSSIQRACCSGLPSSRPPHPDPPVCPATARTPTSTARTCARTRRRTLRCAGTAAGSCTPCGCRRQCSGSSCEAGAGQAMAYSRRKSIKVNARAMSGAVASYSKILPIDAIHLPRTISSSSNMRFVSTTVSPLLVPLSSG